VGAAGLTFVAILLLAVSPRAVRAAGLGVFAGVERRVPVEDGQRLEVDLRSGGRLSIRGGDGHAVVVCVDRDPGADGVEVIVERTSQGALLRSASRRKEWADARFELSVTVPRRFDVQLRSAAGRVTLDGVSGTFRGSILSGDLQLRNLVGTLELTTFAGTVQVSASRLTGQASTYAGDVLIDGDVEGPFRGSSLAGKVVRRSSHALTISSMGALDVAEAPNGAELDTTAGEIRVRSATDHVKARTDAGDITLDRVDGWVDAFTSAGDIDVRTAGDPARGRRDVTLETKSGSIHLTVSARLAMSVDVELTYTRNSRRDYRVRSDLPLAIVEPTGWETADGVPRKVIRAQVRRGDGTHRIVLRATNGDITLSTGP